MSKDTKMENSLAYHRGYKESGIAEAKSIRQGVLRH